LPSPPEAGGSVAQNDNAMGLVYAKIEVINGEDLLLYRKGYIEEADIHHLEIEFLVDTGAYMMTINEEIREKLGLTEVIEKRTAELANGEIIQCDIVGPLEIRYANRRSTQCAMVLPGNAEPLLGAIPMKDMDLVVELRTQRLIVNPEHPLAPQMSLK
jgi:clan AA aspartic protease